MKKFLIALLFLVIMFPKVNAQISDERDAWGNLFTPIVAIQPIVDQKNDPKWSELQKAKHLDFVQRVQRACFSGLSFSQNAHFVDRSITNPEYWKYEGKYTPQYLIKITLHENDFFYTQDYKSQPTDGFLYMTISLINIETSAILKQFPMAIYASQSSIFNKDLNLISEESVNTAIFEEVMENSKKIVKLLFFNVFEVKEIIQEDDDWAEWVAMDNIHLDQYKFGQEMSIVSVKKEYERDGVTYRWSNNIGQMYQGIFGGKKEKKNFYIEVNGDQKRMKKAFKNKERIFGVKY